jgi:hypothetical protein
VPQGGAGGGSHGGAGAGGPAPAEPAGEGLAGSKHIALLLCAFTLLLQKRNIAGVSAAINF